MLSAAELASMRATLLASLGGSAIVQREAYVSDGGGGGSVTWSASGTIPCRLAPITRIGNQEGEMAERITADADWIVTVPHNANVVRDDRLVIDATTYNVASIPNRTEPVSKRLGVNEVT